MSKIQTRRNVSLTLPTYQKVKAYCELYGLSMSSFIEARIKDALDAQPENLLEEGPRVAEEAPAAPAWATASERKAHEQYRVARRRGETP